MTNIKKRINEETKKFYPEVLEGRTVSDKLPEFRKMRKGTEIFIIEKEKRITVYDDYSMYPRSSAKSWKVHVYNIEDGRFYDRITMCNGKYPTRERAIVEVERFKERAEAMIFYVYPVDFTYDVKKFIWPEEEECDCDELVYATEQEQIEEAEKRIYYLTGRTDVDAGNFKNLIKSRSSLQALVSFYNTQKGRQVCAYPFWIIDGLTMKSILYVGACKNDWVCERGEVYPKPKKGWNIEEDDYDDYGCKPQKAGYVSAYVYNTAHPKLSEFGDIGFEYRNRDIWRTA